jgi:uncharacterized protein YfaT (DUF1175 family)
MITIIMQPRVIGTTLATLLLSAAWGCRPHQNLLVQPLQTSLPADGREHLAATLRTEHRPSLHLEDLRVTGYDDHTRLQQDSDAVQLWLRSPVLPGRRHLRVDTQNTTRQITIEFTPDEASDSAADGLPDWMPLYTADDRHAFRAWFTELAERASDAPPADLPHEITDCASLLRYAYREALRRHDDAWYAQFPARQMPSLLSVQQWTYPDTPLRAGLFRVIPGIYNSGEATAFAQFADAKTLMTLNTHPIGRDLHRARPGDLFFYRQLEQNSQYHSMIVTGEHGEWVIYHTGPIGKRKGEMRRMLLADLLHHPDTRWRPETGNSNFLGVYRWNILREDN